MTPDRTAGNLRGSFIASVIGMTCRRDQKNVNAEQVYCTYKTYSLEGKDGRATTMSIHA